MMIIQLVVEEINYLSPVRGRKAALTRTTSAAPDECLTAPVHAFDRLARGQTIDGPAIVESAMTTILLRPGERAVTTPLGWLDIALSAGGIGPQSLPSP